MIGGSRYLLLVRKLMKLTEFIFVNGSQTLAFWRLAEFYCGDVNELS